MFTDRFSGCLLAGAVGDALGYTIEFMSESAIFRRFGEEGIRDLELRNGVARISDDTQMTLFTADGLLRALAHGEGGRVETLRNWMAESYRDWLITQEDAPGTARAARGSHLLGVAELFATRAPGNTCLWAIGSGAHGTVERPINDSCGCGGVMRAAPAGLYGAAQGLSDETIARIGAECAAITHGHPLGYLPAAHLAVLTAMLARGAEDPAEAAEASLAVVQKTFEGTPGLDDYALLIRQAIALGTGSGDMLEDIHRLGEGWTGHDAMAIALCCALRYPRDIGKAIRAAVNHKGDSDSTGAIAGNILGAHLGKAAIPAGYLQDLELRDLLEQTAADLLPGASRDPEWQRRYDR